MIFIIFHKNCNLIKRHLLENFPASVLQNWPEPGYMNRKILSWHPIKRKMLSLKKKKCDELGGFMLKLFFFISLSIRKYWNSLYYLFFASEISATPPHIVLFLQLIQLSDLTLAVILKMRCVQNTYFRIFLDLE